MVTSVNCPRCGQIDTVRKVSAVVASDTSTGSFAGPTFGGGYAFGKQGGPTVGGGYTRLSGGVSTILSQKLTPPAQPEQQGIAWGWWVVLGLTSLLTLSSTFDSEASVLGRIAGALFFGGVSTVMGCVLWQVFQGRKTAFEQAQLKWERATSKYEKLYYCQRCDGVYLPGTGSLHSLTQALIHSIYLDAD